jgi:NADH-quinone oxidoreductase subunit E
MSVTVEETLDLSLMDPILQRYEGQRGALIPILQKSQDIYGYLPPEVLRRIADSQDVALSKVYGVATFYSQFYLERRGRHILKLCDGTACHVKGTPALISAVSEKYGIQAGETTADYELSLEVVYCLGSCALAPVAVLDDQVIGHLTREGLLQELRQCLGETQPPLED